MRYVSALHLGKGLSLITSVLVLGLAFGASEAQAQFKCVNAALSDGGATATAVGSVACGTGADAEGTQATAVGQFAGVGSAATNQNNSAFGTSAGRTVDGANNTALGSGAGDVVTGNGNTAVGESSGFNVKGFGNTATGSAAGSSVTGDDNIANGHLAGTIVKGDNNFAAGEQSGTNVKGSGNIAIGFKAGSSFVVTPLTASNTVSIGTNATASKDDAIAIGNGATAANTNSTAIGAGAKTTADNQQMFGTASNSYTLAGLNTSSTAAQVGPVKLVTADGAGTLGVTSLSSLGLASTADVTNLQSQINSLGHRDKELAGGIAIATALATPTLLSGQTFAMRGGWGNFDGSNALSFSAAGLLSRGFVGRTSSLVVDVGVGQSTETNMTAGRAGVTIGW